MSDNTQFGFGKFVPGFDFLQNIAKGSSPAAPQMPSLSSWVAPTLNLDELQKRIDELKAVHFWLEQNSRALSATVQALELQKMTLATLKSMNVNMAEVASALTLKAGDTLFGKAGDDAATNAALAGGEAAKAPAAAPLEPADSKPRKSSQGSGDAKGSGQSGEQGAASGLVDPLQWWGALTQQFQEIAAAAMKDAVRNPAVEAASNLSAEATRAAMKMAGASGNSAVAPSQKTGSSKAGSKAASKTAAKTPRKSARRGA